MLEPHFVQYWARCIVCPDQFRGPIWLAVVAGMHVSPRPRETCPQPREFESSLTHKVTASWKGSTAQDTLLANGDGEGVLDGDTCKRKLSSDITFRRLAPWRLSLRTCMAAGRFSEPQRPTLHALPPELPLTPWCAAPIKLLEAWSAHTGLDEPWARTRTNALCQKSTFYRWLEIRYCVWLRACARITHPALYSHRRIPISKMCKFLRDFLHLDHF